MSTTIADDLRAIDDTVRAWFAPLDLCVVSAIGEPNLTLGNRSGRYKFEVETIPALYSEAEAAALANAWNAIPYERRVEVLSSAEWRDARREQLSERISEIEKGDQA